MSNPLGDWRRGMIGKQNALLVGGKQWPGSSIHPDWKQNANVDWYVTDVEMAEGIDIVGDIHALHEVTDKCFDGIFSPYVLEHLERPWKAMMSMSQMLNPGGLLYVLTCQTFPLHYYPDDYFRFSKSALITLVKDANLTALSVEYGRPCKVTPNETVVGWYDKAESYLDVSICAVK